MPLFCTLLTLQTLCFMATCCYFTCNSRHITVVNNSNWLKVVRVPTRTQAAVLRFVSGEQTRARGHLAMSASARTHTQFITLCPPVCRPSPSRPADMVLSYAFETISKERLLWAISPIWKRICFLNVLAGPERKPISQYLSAAAVASASNNNNNSNRISNSNSLYQLIANCN